MYTDGASRGNPGPGGYGTILMWNGNEKELSDGYRRTTNNRMELMAVIAGLEALKKRWGPGENLFRQSVCREQCGKRLAENLDRYGFQGREEK